MIKQTISQIKLLSHRYSCSCRLEYTRFERPHDGTYEQCGCLKIAKKSAVESAIDWNALKIY